MAKQPAQPARPAIDDDRVYKVVLTKSIRVGRSVVNPSADRLPRLRGDVLKTVLSASPQAVTSYEAV